MFLLCAQVTPVFAGVLHSTTISSSIYRTAHINSESFLTLFRAFALGDVRGGLSVTKVVRLCFTRGFPLCGLLAFSAW